MNKCRLQSGTELKVMCLSNANFVFQVEHLIGFLD